MTTETETGPGDKPRAIITVILDWTEAEEAIIRARAAEQGLTPEDFIRSRLGLPPFRTLR